MTYLHLQRLQHPKPCKPKPIVPREPTKPYGKGNSGWGEVKG